MKFKVKRLLLLMMKKGGASPLVSSALDRRERASPNYSMLRSIG